MACNSLLKYERGVYQNLYDPRNALLQPDFHLYHSSDTSFLYFRLDSDQLLYTRKNQAAPFKSEFSIKYNLYENFKTKVVLDSSTKVLHDLNQDENRHYIKGRIPIILNQEGFYVLEIITKDLNRNHTKKNLIEINFKNQFSKNNFLITDRNNKIKYTNFLSEKAWIGIESEKLNTENLFISYFETNFSMPAPPHSYGKKPFFNFKPDSIFSQPFTKVNHMSVEKFGVYFIQKDTSTKEGLPIFYFEDNFPFVKSNNALLQPLRYITSNSEFEKLKSSNSLKFDIDNWWLNNVGNKEKTKQVIKEYYSRVQFANKHFSSYIEGWKSDRGLIYIIYGPPMKITKNWYNEVWTYGGNNDYMNKTFTFDKIKNPLTENDFRLQRRIQYKPGWYKAVETWRKGMIYNGNNG